MNIKDFFRDNNKAALAYSGGVDSTYILHEALSAGADVTAYYVKSDFQPQYEFEDAMDMAKELKARVKVINLDILAVPEIASNPVNRCYYCKKAIFGAILDAAAEDGYSVVLDGTNASDSAEERPGMKALRELEVRSPLQECGITKAEVRRRSREAGLKTWDRPAYACLATRVASGEKITAAKLSRVEDVEDALVRFGLVDFRVRTLGDIARLEVREAQAGLVLEHRDAIVEILKRRFDKVVLDLDFREEMDI